MKKLQLTKVIASLLIAVSVLALSPIGASAEWKQTSYSWQYKEGDSYATGWRLINQNWYYFYDNGDMASNTTIDGYYVNKDGAWSTYTPNDNSIYKDLSIVTLSGTLKKCYWEHPARGKLDYFVLELDTPANFNVSVGEYNDTYNGVSEIQVISNYMKKNSNFDALESKVNQHVNLRGVIFGGGGTVYYLKPVTMIWLEDK